MNEGHAAFLALERANQFMTENDVTFWQAKEITARVDGGDVVLAVTDDGAGIAPERVHAVLAGAGGGIGLSNVDARLRATFGERYALRIESALGEGTTAIMTVPNLRGEREAIQVAELA